MAIVGIQRDVLIDLSLPDGSVPASVQNLDVYIKVFDTQRPNENTMAATLQSVADASKTVVVATAKATTDTNGQATVRLYMLDKFKGGAEGRYVYSLTADINPTSSYPIELASLFFCPSPDATNTDVTKRYTADPLPLADVLWSPDDATGLPFNYMLRVIHDSTLEGDGVANSPLGLANGGIKPIHLNTSGSFPPGDGQVPAYDSATDTFKWGEGGGGGGGGGTITRVSAGEGLTGGGSTGNVTLAVDEAKVPVISSPVTNDFVQKTSTGWATTAIKQITDAERSKLAAMFRASAWYIAGQNLGEFGLMRFNDSQGNILQSAGSWNRLAQIKLNNKGSNIDPSNPSSRSTDALDDVFANLELGGCIKMITTQSGGRTVTFRVTSKSLLAGVYTLGVALISASGDMLDGTGHSWQVYIDPYAIVVTPNGIAGIQEAGNYKYLGTNGTGNAGFWPSPQKSSVADDIAGTDDSKFVTPLGLHETYGHLLVEADQNYTDWSAADYSKSGTGSGVTGGAISNIPGNPVPIDDTTAPATSSNPTKYHTDQWAGTKPPTPSGNTFGCALEVFTEASGTGKRYLIAYFHSTGAGVGRQMFQWTGSAWSQITYQAAEKQWLTHYQSATNDWQLFQDENGHDVHISYQYSFIRKDPITGIVEYATPAYATANSGDDRFILIYATRYPEIDFATHGVTGIGEETTINADDNIVFQRGERLKEVSPNNLFVYHDEHHTGVASLTGYTYKTGNVSAAGEISTLGNILSVKPLNDTHKASIKAKISNGKKIEVRKDATNYIEFTSSSGVSEILGTLSVNMSNITTHGTIANNDTVSLGIENNIPARSELATVAFTGDYDDLTDTPGLPAAPANQSTAKVYELNVPASSGSPTWAEAVGGGIDIHDDVTTELTEDIADDDRIILSNESATGDPTVYSEVSKLRTYTGPKDVTALNMKDAILIKELTKAGTGVITIRTRAVGSGDTYLVQNPSPLTGNTLTNNFVKLVIDGDTQTQTSLTVSGSITPRYGGVMLGTATSGIYLMGAPSTQVGSATAQCFKYSVSDTTITLTALTNAGSTPTAVRQQAGAGDETGGVMFGGFNSSNTSNNNAYSYSVSGNTITWTSLTNAGSTPSARHYCWMQGSGTSGIMMGGNLSSHYNQFYSYSVSGGTITWASLTRAGDTIPSASGRTDSMVGDATSGVLWTAADDFYTYSVSGTTATVTKHVELGDHPLSSDVAIVGDTTSGYIIGGYESTYTGKVSSYSITQYNARILVTTSYQDISIALAPDDLVAINAYNTSEGNGFYGYFLFYVHELSSSDRQFPLTQRGSSTERPLTVKKVNNKIQAKVDHATGVVCYVFKLN